MGCRAIHMWTLSGLVGAFLDLAIAYFLLCASAISYLAAKFLGFFGLCLPCPCNGLFIAAPNSNHCLQRLLVDFPTQTVSNVQHSMKQKFPFNDSISENNQNGKVINENVKGILEIEGEASCSSLSDARRSRNVPRRQLNLRKDRSDMKGKRVVNYTRKGGFGLRKRRKGSVDGGNYSLVSSYDPSLCGEQDGAVPMSPYSIDKIGNEFSGGISLPLDNEDATHNIEYDEEAPTIMGLRQGVFESIQLDKCPGEDMYIRENVPFVEDLKEHDQGDLSSNGDEKNAIRFLKQALEEEHAAGLALYQELEKERSAAATAADEAMAMILRLQEEKASIEMEARQYQRILEEKSAYDAEEMDILKEIMVRREREKLFLEKEVEMYRQMNGLEDKQLAHESGEKNDPQLPVDSSFDPNEDLVLMLHELSASVEKKVMIENNGSDDSVSIDKQKCKVDIGNESPVQGSCENASFQKQEDLGRLPLQMSICSSDSTVELQEKEMISVDDNLYMLPRDPQEINFPEKTIPLVRKEHEGNEKNLFQKSIYPSNGTETGDPYDTPHLTQHRNNANHGFHDLCNLVSENDSHVYDVHVIGNGSNFSNDENGSKGEQFLGTDTSEVDRKNDVPLEASVAKMVVGIADCPGTSGLNTELDSKRSSSDMTSWLPPTGPRCKPLLSDMRRSSMSAVDTERLKINSEIFWLLERLRTVQEGREKLSISVEHRERERVQMELLENIVRQLHEIRQLTEPGKAVRQASLPPPSSKGMSKKRRCRSVSSGLQINPYE
ncbi:Hypothetical predicted protein [Olea europaea subsp. europaea]|uniref:GTD-binding domain-containing protein n=1 Tax=Olea europaea subsp. europaea TaxID=158383 RepID=A0A8S0RFK3_OLEEU|nr:Hypothetical predicted protein [Olea europaea subsp. europaea]